MFSKQIPQAIYGRDWGPRILCAVGCAFAALFVFGLGSWWMRGIAWGGIVVFVVVFFRKEGRIQLFLFEDHLQMTGVSSASRHEILYDEIVFVGVPLGSTIVLRLRDGHIETLSLWHRGDSLQEQILSRIQAKGGLLVQKEPGSFEVVWRTLP